jgi:uncharacterized caspase-like protein
MIAAKNIVPFRLLTGLLLCLLAWPAAAQQAQERRIALVIGNAAYPGAELATTANDAGLIAQQLQAAGFDVSGARDLDGDSLRRAFRDFVDKARQAGPDSVAMVYFAGYGLQFEGENYIVPVDAQIPTAADTPIQAVRVSDLTQALAQLPMKARIIVLDAARENPFARQGQPVASGLALVQPDPGVLIAFNAAPGTVAPAEKSGDAYGAYARALAEMIREGGAPLKDVFDQVRLRVSDSTQGAVVPWEADRVEANFVFFDRAPDAPAPPNAGLSTLRDRPMRELGPNEAYQAALARDTIPAYQDYLAAYPHDREARRVRAILAARREALIWRRTLENGTAEGYWSYLRLYPRGPHAFECRRWLSRLAAASEPPPDFQPIDYDLPPPPPDEIVIVDQPVLMFADPFFDLPPPPPVVVLAPPPDYIVDLPPPPPPEDVFFLPTPVFVPLPIFINRPVYCAPPPVSVIAYNIHNTVIVNQNTVIVKDPAGRPVPPLANAVAAGVIPRGAALPPGKAVERGGPPRLRGAGQPNPLPALAALRVALPPSVAARVRQPNPTALGAHANIPRAGAVTNAPPPANIAGAVPPGHATGLTGHALPGQPTGDVLPGQPRARPLPGRMAPLPQGQGQPALGRLPQAPPVPPATPTAGQVQRQRLEKQRAQELRQQKAQPLQQQRAPQAPQQRTQQMERVRAQQIKQQRAQQIEQQRAQQMQQQRAQQMQQQRAQQLQQQRAQQMQQQRAQQMQQQRAQQMMQQQRAQQMQQQRAQQMQQQRAQQLQQQRAIQAQQQRAQQMQMQLQRAQQMQQQRQMMRQAPHQAPGACGRPGLPPCG